MYFCFCFAFWVFFFFLRKVSVFNRNFLVSWAHKNNIIKVNYGELVAGTLI